MKHPFGTTTRLNPTWVLAAMMAASGVLIFWWAGERTFVLDEWDYVTQRVDWTFDNLARPANGHLIALPLVVYKFLLSGFGASSHLPFTLLTAVLHLCVGGLVYVIVARRLGTWLALLPAALVLFYGAGWEVMLNTGAMQNQFGMAAGLGMLLCLDRGDRRGDLLAGLLLAASLASFTIGLAFAVGAAARLFIDRAERPVLRRLALVALPLLAYGIWFAWARQYPGTGITGYSLGSFAGGVFDELNGITAGLTGMFRPTGGPELGTSLTLVVDRTTMLTISMGALIAFVLVRGPRQTSAAWSALAVLLAYLILIAVGLDGLRIPDASRYVYMGSVLLIVAAAELLAGVQITRGWALAATAATAVSLVANVAQIHTGGTFFERESALNRAELTALELSRASVDLSFVVEGDLEPAIFPNGDLLFPAEDYFSIVDRFGSPAYSEQELEAAPVQAREAADTALIGALRIAVGPPAPTSGRADSSGTGDLAPAPALVAQINAEPTTQGSCLRARPPGPGPMSLTVEIPPSGLAFASRSAPDPLVIWRFADVFSSAEVSAPTSTGTLVIPNDFSSRPWHTLMVFSQSAEVCTLAGDALNQASEPTSTGGP